MTNWKNPYDHLRCVQGVYVMENSNVHPFWQGRPNRSDIKNRWEFQHDTSDKISLHSHHMCVMCYLRNSGCFTLSLFMYKKHHMHPPLVITCVFPVYTATVPQCMTEPILVVSKLYLELILWKEIASLSWNCRQWLHRKWSKSQIIMQPETIFTSKWRLFRFAVGIPLFSERSNNYKTKYRDLETSRDLTPYLLINRDPSFNQEEWGPFVGKSRSFIFM